MRLILRSLLVSVLGLALGGASSAAAVSAVERNGGGVAPGGPLLGAPLVAPPVDQLLDGQGSRAAREARRSSPVAVAERQAARSKYEDLTTARSASAARAAFPELIEHPAGGAPRLPAGQRIVRYPTDHAAQVSLPGGKALVESIAPIARKSSHGRHVPLDLRLREAGGHFEPVLSDAAVLVPKDLARGVSLTTAGVSLTPVGAHGAPLAASQGSLNGAGVQWTTSSGAADLATLAKALPTGFDLTTVLFSQRSPKQLYFRVGMPRGARLKPTGDGSVQVIGEQGTLAVISHVSAQDAEGLNVPVSTTVHGNVLRIEVERSGDYLYPIAVDPEVNDGQLAKTTAGKRSNWEFFTYNGTRFEGKAVYESPGVEHLETKGIAEYAPTEWAYWGYQTKGVSHIYELKTETSAKNKLAKIESFLEFLEPGGARETKKMLSNEFENPEYEKKATTICAANASKVEECLPASGKANNAVHFQQSATGSPGSNYKFSDSMSQGIVSIAEPTGTHSTTSYNTTTSEFEFEVEVEGKKEKIKRKNALFGTSTWLTKYGGALELIAKDTGIGVSKTKLEYESSPGSWTQLAEHNYLEVENACQGVQCYVTHSEFTTLPTLLPDGEQKIRYKAEEAMSGTQSLSTEGQATVKVDTAAPHGVDLEDLPFGNELSERPYELTGVATDGQGSTVVSSGIKSIALFIDGSEFGTAGGACTAEKGACTGSTKWTVNGAELGAGRHAIVIVATDNAGNEKRVEMTLSIRHSTPVSYGPGALDLESGDFTLAAGEVSLGSGLTVGRNYSSRGVLPGNNGPLGPQWNLSMGSTESLEELVDGAVLMTAGNGSQTIFANLGEGKFESPAGDSNLELSLEENTETKQKLAYYLKNPAAHTSVKFTKPAGGSIWVPTKQEGTTASDTLTYSYQASEQYAEYALPSESRPRDIVSGSDGKLWFVLPGTAKLGTVSTTGKITEYTDGFNAGENMAAGPDGNLWITGIGAGVQYITKMNTSGEKSNYSLPESTKAGVIAAGPDGNVWFIVTNATKVGKITPSGAVTLYSLPTGTGAKSLTAGPDGNLWITDSTKNKILRMTPAGAITAEYALPAESTPSGIVSGPEGKLWFTDTKLKKIGKISTGGTVTEYSVSGEVSLTSNIVAGPDGNVWFTTGGSKGKVGKITTSGTVTTYSPAEDNLKGLAVGPDGNIWFSGEYPSSAIGTIPISGVTVRPTEVLAPKPAGVSCEPELQAGCRALKFKYASATTATGEASSQWGEFKSRLTKVLADVYNPSTKEMQETAVAEYAYDKWGRLRAEWDPRISPALKTMYGYDEEGHVTAMSPPGQEPWVLTYGTIAGDAGKGRLLKATRPPASTALWNGGLVESVVWTYEGYPSEVVRPKITGTLAEGVQLKVTNGTWSTEESASPPLSYSYQWKDCDSVGQACKAIGGATNPNYTLKASDVGHTIVAAVTATGAGNSLTTPSKATPVVAVSGAVQFTEFVTWEGMKPYGLTTGSDGNLWFTSELAGKVDKITPSGAITEYSSGATSPRNIATGGDGNAWYPGNSKNVVRMTTSGTTTSYAIERPSLVDVAPGPDGNLWLIEGSSTSKIDKVSTSGTVLGEYTLSGTAAGHRITAGPDGKLWFTRGETTVGKITTSGTITEYSLPAKSNPEGIVAGPDGNLWFTESKSSKIGKITTSGTITEYALPSGSEPRGIAAGADGNLWFTDYGSSKIGMITTSGTITEYGMASGSKPLGITAGPGETIWYTNYGAHSVVKVNLKTAGGVTGETVAPQPGSTIEYGVPLTSGSGLQNMTESEVAKWGQKDDPVEATAIVPPDEVQGWPASSYKRATVYYLDEQGREVNVAKPSTATYGSISTTEYNEFNDPIRTLSADNRATALAAGASSAEVSKLLDTQNTYNGEGKKESEVIEAGTRLIDTLGPQHEIKYFVGKEQKSSLARSHKQFVYDQGAPEGEPYDLVTEEFELAQLANHEEVEVRTTKTSYSGQSNLGWKLRAPTSTTVDPEGLNLTTTTEYDPVTGQIKEARGAGADTTLSYTNRFTPSGSGKLKHPWGIAVDAENNLWIADKEDNRVAEFSPEGTFIKAFGELGSEPGKFNEPEGIAIDSSGHIWVADTNNNRLEEFSATGTYMAQFGSLGSEPGKFKAPSAVTFDAKEKVLWVADTGNNRIERFDMEGKYVSTFGSLGSENGQLKAPEGVAVDANGLVWVADTGNNRVQAFTKTGTFSGVRGPTGSGSGLFSAPRSITADAAGNLWIADAGNGRVQKLDPAGRFITQLGTKGLSAGQLWEPRGVAVDANGRAWVTEMNNNRFDYWSKGPNAHDVKTIYYSAEANTEGYPACGSHPEWAGLVCETMPTKQPELGSSPVLPITTVTYNMWNEPEVATETFGTKTRTKKETYDAAGRRATSETTATTGTTLPKVTFEYNKETGRLEKRTTSGEPAKVLTSEYDRLGRLVKYSDSDGNSAKYKYAEAENDYLLEELSDSSSGGSSSQKYTYDTTSKLMNKLVDSAAGTFTATYDAEGKLTSEVYPNSMCATYQYNSAAEATSVKYIKASNCSESEPLWYSNSRVSSVRGELLSQTSTLASEAYAYDAAGRLIETQETPTGEGCSTRVYAYDPEADRTSLTSRAPGGGGACQSEGGTAEGHVYDEAGRLIDSGVSYDGYGNVTKLPAADAEGHELTSTYYVDNAVASQTQNGVTNSYALDPEGRVRETTTGTKKVVSHYDGSGESVAWTSESAESWTRNIPGIDGALTAVQTNGETPILQLHDLEGNVVATLRDKIGETSLLSSYNSTEFGVPNAGKTPPKFAWLGATGVESSLASGVVTYGSTSYVPQTGRPLQSEQVEPPGLPGGSGSGAAYTAQEEPWNMQGAARAGAEAPGLEAAREQEALEAAMAAAEGGGGQTIGGGGDLFVSGGGGASASVAGSPECTVKWKLTESEGQLWESGGYLCKHKMPHMEMSLCLWYGYPGKGWKGATCTGHGGKGNRYDNSTEEEELLTQMCTQGLMYTGAIWVRQWGPGGHTGWWETDPWEKHHPRLICEGSGYDGNESIGEGLG
jgi:streptogramin lyase